MPVAVVLFWLPSIKGDDVLGRNESAIESFECFVMTREERRVEIAAEAEAAAEVMLRSRMIRLVITSMLASWSATDDDDDDDDDDEVVLMLVDPGEVDEVVDKGGVGVAAVMVVAVVEPTDVAVAAAAGVVLAVVVVPADVAVVDPEG